MPSCFLPGGESAGTLQREACCGWGAGQRPDRPPIQTGGSPQRRREGSSPVQQGLGGRGLEPGVGPAGWPEGSTSQECQGQTGRRGGLGTLAPAPCCLLRAPQGTPVAATHTWPHLVGVEPQSPRPLWPGAPWAGTGRRKIPKGSKDRLTKLGEAGRDGGRWASPQVCSRRLSEGGHFWKEGSARGVMLPTTLGSLAENGGEHPLP